MADPVQNQHTRFFRRVVSVVRSVPDQGIQTECFNFGCSFCSRQIMLAVFPVQNQHMRFFSARSSVVRFV